MSLLNYARLEGNRNKEIQKIKMSAKYFSFLSHLLLCSFLSPSPQAPNQTTAHKANACLFATILKGLYESETGADVTFVLPDGQLRAHR